MQFFCIALTVLVYCCSLCQSFECTVLTENNEGFFNYLIKTTDENYTITAICKCTVKVPKWKQLNNDGEYDVAVLQDYVMKIDTEKTMIDYTVTESLILVCGNSNGNYARPISIVLEKQHEECISNSSNDTIKQSPTVTLQQSSSTVALQSSSILFPFTQSSTINDDIFSSGSFSSWSHDDLCSSIIVTRVIATEWQTLITERKIEPSIAITSSLRSTNESSYTTEGRICIYVGTGISSAVVTGFILVLLVLIVAFIKIKMKKYKVNRSTESREPDSRNTVAPLEVVVPVNPAYVLMKARNSHQHQSYQRTVTLL